MGEDLPTLRRSAVKSFSKIALKTALTLFMTTHSSAVPLHDRTFSLEHDALVQLLAKVENLLIIQDLDGVCMGLVKDPATRTLDPDYVEATRRFEGHFYTITNGEHIGPLGVNGIVERAFGGADFVKTNRLYLPGLAAGGVQWQDRDGVVSHPGVSEAELAFLAAVPEEMRHCLQDFFARHPSGLGEGAIATAIQSTVLKNPASPTANLNTCHALLRDRADTYIALQQAVQTLTDQLLQDAEQQGLGNAFFVHYAPNLGRDADGNEIPRPAQQDDSGTTDFQFMLQGGVKEAGVLFLLNRYYFQRTGHYPLGEDFNVRQAPKQHDELLDLVKTHFDPQHMPTLVGVGDTVTSTVQEDDDGELTIRRGGSDRNFLQLIQDLGKIFNTGNVVVYVDSSQGEVKNRKPLKLSPRVANPEANGEPAITVVEGPGDGRDRTDPLRLNVVFPGGHQQYTDTFQQAARKRQ